MIKTFADSDTRALFETGQSKRLPADIVRRALRKLEYVDNARWPNERRLYLRNRLHALKGDRTGQFSISINGQWRICFRFEPEGVYDVEIRDHH